MLALQRTYAAQGKILGLGSTGRRTAARAIRSRQGAQGLGHAVQLAYGRLHVGIETQGGPGAKR